MSRCRFVQPETVRIDLSDGDWIVVNRQLSVGQDRALMASLATTKDGTRTVNLEMAGVAELDAYIVAWSFCGPDGKPVEKSLDAIRNLDLETFHEIDRALAAHLHGVRAEKKTATSGAPASAATSLSAV